MSDPKKPTPKATAPAIKTPVKVESKPEEKPVPKVEKIESKSCGSCTHYKPTGTLKDVGDYGKCLKWIPTLPTNHMTPHGAINRYPLVLVHEDPCGAYQAKS